MSDQSLEGAVITSRLIASIAARTAIETPGVLRLEPTPHGFMARFRPAAVQNRRNPRSLNGTYRHNGVTATISDGTARVHLEIATDIAYTALLVAEAVQLRVRESISHTGLSPGTVDVTVVAIEPHRDTAVL